MTSKLFSPIKLRELTLSNRIVVSPMGQYRAGTNGSVGDWHIMHLGQFSLGGSGSLVITEATAVSPTGRASYQDSGLWSDDNEAALKRVIDFCKKHGPAVHGIQLGHAGRKSSIKLPWDNGGGPMAPEAGGWKSVAPSPIPFAPGWQTPSELSVAEMQQIKADFVSAVQRADRVGYDLIELHAGHGYLMHQFMSPLSNQRKDQYGGSLENRIRFPLEVFEAMRKAWPAHKPMGIRISATDWMEGGWGVEDAVVLAHRLRALECDYMDVSSGGLDLRQQIPVGPGYQVSFATRIRAETGITVMTVGLITDPREAEEIIASGKADMIAMGRGAMWNPRWAWYAAEELGVETEYAPATALCHPSLRPWIFKNRGG